VSPSGRSAALLGGWLVLAGVAAWRPELLVLWWGAGAALAFGLALDGMRLAVLPDLHVARSAAHTLALGVWSGVSLSIENPSRRTLRLTVYDHPPAGADLRGLPRSLRLSAGTAAELAYGVRPLERGTLRFERPELLLFSPWGLWRARRRPGEAQGVRVYPNFRAVAGYSLLAIEHRTSQLGVRRRPRRGEGLEFHQLREYRPGDALRQIDWKVTARVHRTISREYQDERDQQIVFLLDCGRKMHARDHALSHFDHALNAVLLLAHVGLRQGDAVGLLTFSGPSRWLAPRKGARHLHPLMNSVYDLQSSTRASDYLLAARELSARVTKRALVVLVSNLRDEDHDELLLAARLLARRHLVLLASMKERVLSSALAAPIEGADDAVRVAATHQYLAGRARAHQLLRAAGVLALDAEPDQLAVALVNGYLDIKSRGVL
jgi:uncharacterized protein (DUF58 family)